MVIRLSIWLLISLTMIILLEYLTFQLIYEMYFHFWKIRFWLVEMFGFFHSIWKPISWNYQFFFFFLSIVELNALNYSHCSLKDADFSLISILFNNYSEQFKKPTTIRRYIGFNLVDFWVTLAKSWKKHDLLHLLLRILISLWLETGIFTRLKG